MKETVIRLRPYVREPPPPSVPKQRPLKPSVSASAVCNRPTERNKSPEPQQPLQRRGVDERSPLQRSQRHMSSPSINDISTSPTDNEKFLGRQDRVEISRPMKAQRPKEDAHSHKHDIGQYPSPKITVPGRSPLRQGHFADTGSITRTSEETQFQVPQAGVRSPKLGHEVTDSAARMIEDDRRLYDVMPVREHLLGTEPTEFHFIGQPTQVTHVREAGNDPEVKVDTAVTACGKPPVTKPRATPAPLMSRCQTQEQEMVSLSNTPEENMKLLKKLVAGSRLELGGATVTVEVQQKRIHVGGSADQIEAGKMKVLESLTRMCSSLVDVSQKQLQLLMSDRGQRWLEDLMERNGGPVVVLYTKKATGYIAAVDDDVISQVKSILKKSLDTKKISFGSELPPFLQSSQWADAVERYESSWFLCLTRDDRAGNIVLDGCMRSVRDVGVEVRQLLKQNCELSREIQLKSGECQLLEKHFKDEIGQCLKNQQG